MSSSVIVVRDLVKYFGVVKALDGLSLDFVHGVNGFLGPNGAGKTTTLLIIMGLLKPDGGSVNVLGFDPISDGIAVRDLVGFFPEHDVLNIDIEANKFIVHMGMVSGLSREEAVRRLSKIAVFLDMGEEIHRSLRTLSQGMKQKVKLAIALINDPQILLLDEPTAGLDPIAREKMLDLILRLNKDLGKDIVLSTHILRDVEAICEHLVLINSGKAVYVGEKGSVLNKFSTRFLVKLVKSEESNLDSLKKALEEENYVVEVVDYETIYITPMHKKFSPLQIVELVKNFGFGIRTFREERVNLDEIFERIIGGGLK